MIIYLHTIYYIKYQSVFKWDFSILTLLFYRLKFSIDFQQLHVCTIIYDIQLESQENVATRKMPLLFLCELKASR